MGSFLFGSKIKDVTPFLPPEFESANGKVKKEDLLTNDLIGVYFSAHWCGPCRAFTPKLVQFYKDVNKDTKQIEIIFNSADQDLKSFNEYFSTMPWIATPFDSESKSQIDDACGINSIPQLIIFDYKGHIIDDNGRSTVEKQGNNAINVWKEKLAKIQNEEVVEISKA